MDVNDEISHRTLSRREFVEAAALTGVLGASAILAGCSADAPPQQSSQAQSSSATQAEGESTMQAAQTEKSSPFPPHAPIGTGVGAKPGRVAWAFDPEAVTWNADSPWWQPSNFNAGVVAAMLTGCITSLAGEDDVSAAWDQLFRWFNNHKHGADSGYQAGQSIAVKVNMNGYGPNGDEYNGSTGTDFANMIVVRALLESLVQDASVPPQDITVYDASRLISADMKDYCSTGALQGVRFEDRANIQRDTSAVLEWSEDLGGQTSYLPTCVTGADYLVNLANLKGHVYAGFSLTAKNHFGSFLNDDPMQPPAAAGLHPYVIDEQMNEYNPLADIIANPYLGGNTLLYLIDGLLAASSEVATITREAASWQQPPFNGGFTASLFASQDPVAIDTVGADFLMAEPAVTEKNSALRGKMGTEGYLHEAALVGNPPSGHDYHVGDGVESLGVHDHWNYINDKLYSRNLGDDEGIELIQVP